MSRYESEHNVESAEKHIWSVTKAPGPASLPLIIKEFNPNSFDKDSYINVWSSKSLCLNDDQPATQHELMPLYKAHLDLIKQQCSVSTGTKSVRTILDLDKKSIIVFSNHQIEKKYHGVLKVYDGQDRPDGLEFYERMFLGRADQGNTKVRWVRVESMKVGPAPSKDVAVLEKGMTPLPEGCKRYHFDMDIDAYYKSDHCGLLNFVAETEEKTLGLHAKGGKAPHLIDTLLKLEYASDSKSFTVLGNKYYLRSSSTIVHGVELRSGVAKTLRRGDDDYSVVYLSERKCHQLFLPATSLARFIEAYFGKTSALSQDQLTDVLKGIQVKICIPQQGWTKTICDFSTETPEQQRITTASGGTVRVADHYDQHRLTYPHLPCVNLGSSKRPYYVPAELCSILPDQTFRHAGDATFQREVAALRTSLEPNDRLTHIAYHPDADSTSQKRVQLEQSGLPGIDEEGLLLAHGDAFLHYARCANWRWSSLQPASVLFVEASSAPITSRAWTEFQGVARSLARRPYSSEAQYHPIAQVFDSVPHLCFTHDKCEATWTDQILEAVGQGFDQSTLVVVFAIQDGDDRVDIFKTIKQVCNGKDLGVQSVGVRIDTLRQKMMTDKVHGLTHFVHEIYRKMFARTPEILAKDRDQPLAVGVHVTSMSRKKGIAPWYLITLVSRQLEHSREYRSSFHIFDPEQQNDTDMPGLDQMFFDHLKRHDFNVESAPRRVVVFYSGTALPTAGKRPMLAMDTPNDKCDDADASSSSLYYFALTKVLAKGLIRLQWVGSCELFCVDVSRDARAAVVTKTQDAITHTVSTHRLKYMAHTSKAPKGTIFIETPVLPGPDGLTFLTLPHNTDATDSVYTRLQIRGAVRIEGSRGDNIGLSPEKGSQPRPSARRQASNPFTKPQYRDNLAMGDRVNSIPASDDDDIVSTKSDRSMIRQPKSHHAKAQTELRTADVKPKPMGRKDAVREELARAFHDSHIGLHHCNFPVPTYLARRLAGWALAHGAYEEVSSTNGQKYETMQVPVVHERRRNTLWYL